MHIFKNWSIKFANGKSISVSIGDGLYNTGDPGTHVTSVEVLRSSRDDVEGWITIEHLLDIMADEGDGTIVTRR